MGKGLLLETHIGMQVDLGCFRRFMAEPECDHAQVYTVLKQVHGCRVSQGVWSYRLLFERGTRLTCTDGMSSYESLESICTEACAARGGKDGIVRVVIPQR